MKRGYYEYLKKLIDDARFENQDLDKTLTYIPEFFKVLCDLLDEEDIYVAHGHMINSALAYFVIPNDIIPEEIYNTWGFIDDLYVCSAVLLKIYSEFPKKVEAYWPLGSDVQKVLDVCHFKSRWVLEERNLREKVLDFAGLDQFIKE